MSYYKREQGPKSTFSTYISEADRLFRKGKYSKAVEGYSTALLLQPGDRNCLVARSRCYVKMGETGNALKDAESSLKDKKSYFKGLYQKAEVLYTIGDFEFALIFYHCARNLRPQVEELRLGIQSAEVAISNSVGSPSSVKLEDKGDLSFFNKADENKGARPKSFIHRPKKDLSEKSQKMPKSERTAKQLLGDLYSDKVFLEKLLKDEDLMKGKTRTGERLQDIVISSISYLDARTEFWRQEKPIYARERDRKLLQQQWNRTRNRPPSDIAVCIFNNLEEIDAELTKGNTENSLAMAQEVLKTVQGWSDQALPNKAEVLGILYSCIGNALMDLGNMDKALENHLKDLELAQQDELMDSKSRAMDNIGRVYVCTGKFHQAIKVWEEKIPLIQDRLEKAWLFREIGQCYLELEHYTKARDYGIHSLGAADVIGDEKRQLIANVLVSQAEYKLENYMPCMLHFAKTLDQVDLLQDNDEGDAFQKALQETRQQASQ